MAVYEYKGIQPQIHPSVFIAESADVIGQVRIGAESNVWFQVVIRGDVNFIEIGNRTNIQDHSCLHVTRKTAPLIVGSEVTVGHQVILHGCTIEDRVLVGMGAIVMDQAVIPSECIVGAGSMVTMGKRFESGSLILGSPAKAVRKLTEEELAFLSQSAANYVQDAKDYQTQVQKMPGAVHQVQ
ncbi:MAG: gamma carbonic anhydrase family protein [Bradymonadales bacterium]|nr:MAG: gamma carbonic anhydrase family protein [Bradymonadales bacterium]